MRFLKKSQVNANLDKNSPFPVQFFHHDNFFIIWGG